MYIDVFGICIHLYVNLVEERLSVFPAEIKEVKILHVNNCSHVSGTL